MAGDDLDGFGEGEPTLRQQRLTRLVLLGSVAAMNAAFPIHLAYVLEFNRDEPAGFAERLWWAADHNRASIVWIIVAALALDFPQIGGGLAISVLTAVGLLLALRTFMMIGLSGI